jgi:hypothetical protein
VPATQKAWATFLTGHFVGCFLAILPVMLFRRQIEDLDLTAPELHRLLLKLQAERALAVETGVAEAALYMADIDEEIELCRELYVLFAVTELATLRAEISGPHTG